MKNKVASFSIFALAATPAFAQTSGAVEIYGQLTAAITYKDHQTGGGSTKELSNGLLAASLLGFRGQEDLGGGMSATFRLETAIASDTGTAGSASKFWNRQSFVGLNPNKQVSITLGRQFHAGVDRVIRTLDVYNVGGTSLHVTPLGLFGVNRFVGNDSRADDSIKVRATGPLGLQGALSVGLNDGAGRSTSFDLAQVTPNYAIGVWGVKYRSPNVVAATGATPEHSVLGIGGNAPIGPARLYLHVLSSRLDPTVAGRQTQTNKIVHVGAQWTAAPTLILKTGLYHDRGRSLNGVAARDGTKTTAVLSGEYFLSKRTSLNATSFSNRFSDGYKLDPVNIAALTRDSNASSTQGVSTGIRHDF